MIQPRAFRTHAGTTCHAGLVVDVLLAPEQRSALAFTSLVRAQSKVPGFDLLVHTSNAVSDPLYRKLLRYPVAFELQAYGLPIRARRLAERVAGRSLPSAVEVLSAPWRWSLTGLSAAGRSSAGLALTEGGPADDELSSILQRFRALAGPHFERSARFLDWRFRQGPVFKGNVSTLRFRDEIRGVLAWRMVELIGLDFLVVMDIVLAAPLTATERAALVVDLARLASQEGADLLFLMVNPANPLLSAFAKPPMIPISSARLPHPTPIFMLPRRDDLNWLREHASTYMTLADIDYF